jgi:pyruvate kinase
MARQLALVWGVVPVVCDLGTDVAQALDRINEMLISRSLVAPSSVIVVVSISPDLEHGPSNFLKLQRI